MYCGQNAHEAQYILLVIFYLSVNQKTQEHSAMLIPFSLCERWSELDICIQSCSVLFGGSSKAIACARKLSVPQCVLEGITNSADGNAGWMHLRLAERTTLKTQSFQDASQPAPFKQ